MNARILLAVLAAVVGISLAGCNTIEGVGKDLKRAGEKVQGAARN